MARHAVIAATTFLLLASCLDGANAEALRGSTSETWRLLSASSETPAVQHVLQERSFQWIQNASRPNDYTVQSSGKIGGDQAILVFHDRTVDAAAKAEAALVSFDIKSNPNCVVSVCGTFRNWYMGSSEQCWDLKVAPKKADSENGVIRGISAAYTKQRPVANKMYLKFDAVNYIDGSACEYEVLQGHKTVTTESESVTMTA